MICNKCGAEIADNSKFCEYCGAELEAVEETAPVAEETPMVEEVPKKKKGGKIVIGIVAVIVALAALATVAFCCFKDTFVRFASPEYQQLYAYGKLADKLADGYGDAMTEIPEDTAGKGEVSIALSDTVKALVTDMGIDISGVESIAVAYDSNVTKDMMSLDLAASYNGTELINANLAMDIKNRVITASVPELSDQAIKMDMSAEDVELTDEERMMASVMSSLPEYMPEAELIEKLLPKYVEIALKQVSGVTKESTELEINGVGQKATMLTTEFTEKMLGDVETELLKQIKTDADIKENFVEIADKLGYEGEDAYKDFITDIDETLEMAEEEELTDDVVVTLNTWVDSSFDIIAVKLFDDEGDLFVGGVEDGEKVEAELTFDEAGEELIKVSCSGTNKRDVYDGEISITYQGTKAAVLKCEGIETVSETFTGKVTVTSDVLSESLGSELAGLAQLTLEGKTDGKKQTVVLGVGAGDSVLGSITVSFEEHDVVAPKLHENATEDLEAWAAEIDTEALMTKLTDSGLMDIVSSLMMNSLGGYDDEYYDEDLYADYTDYDYGYDAGYTDGYFDSAWGDEYGTCYGESAEDDTDEYMQGYEDGYDDGYADGLDEAAA